MRTGDFSELLDSTMQTLSGDSTQYPACYPGLAGQTTKGAQTGWIFDPTTCDPTGVNPPQQFSGNIIPKGRLNPAAVNYLNAYPTPSRSDRYHNNYLDTQSENNKYNTFDGRLDWVASPSDNAFFRYSYDNSVNSKTSEFANLPAGGGTEQIRCMRADMTSATRTSSHRPL